MGKRQAEAVGANRFPVLRGSCPEGTEGVFKPHCHLRRSESEARGAHRTLRHEIPDWLTPSGMTTVKSFLSGRLWCRLCLPQRPYIIVRGRFDGSSPLRAADARLVLSNQVARSNQEIRSTSLLKKGSGPRAADFRRKSGLDATNRPSTIKEAVWVTRMGTKPLLDKEAIQNDAIPTEAQAHSGDL